ncbi:IclR family transcriptional regulator [Haloarcula amylovorans]|uniref:IclR family transcriptional regulator n=1 Tax=Haloarcula amylovorans TaxID=2562280 RepID=UPI00142FAAE2|nr:IclR family transcriptional regulator [Halomicroarcula amylolytica]
MKVLEKTCDILDCLSSAGSLELGAIAAQTDLPRSTVHHHLTTLEKRGFVINDRGTYRLGLRFLDIGEKTRQRTDLFQIVQSEIDELAQTMNTQVTVFILEQNHAVALYTSGENPGLPTTLHAGQHLPLHATASGKALLSEKIEKGDGIPMEDLRMYSYTKNTITEEDTLKTVIRRVANQGYAITKEERWTGQCGIAVPFSPTGENLVASVGTSLTSDEIEQADLHDLVSDIKQTVNVIEIKSDYSQ